jgi:hypothetical protein
MDQGKVRLDVDKVFATAKSNATESGGAVIHCWLKTRTGWREEWQIQVLGSPGAIS